MANVHAERFNANKDCTVVAAADVDLARAEGFAAKHNIGSAFTGIKELLRESKFDAVSIVTPDASMRPWLSNA